MKPDTPSTETTAASRSRAALPSDYRRVLEASNLPIEQAVAIADMVELALRSDTAARDAALEEVLRQISERTNRYMGTVEDYYLHGLWMARTIVQSLKNTDPQENKTETASQGAGFLAPADGSLSNSSAPAESASPCVVAAPVAWLYVNKKTGAETITHQPPDRLLFASDYTHTPLYRHSERSSRNG